ncbi:hypothetical protein Gorai_018789 [Gossypium raimondii]|uniref:Uncharacterized protein n=1 Tax=Gossypium raimondii TaxID=29730 RepID=A0A7J8PM56_GOSRA|nr:hypothetical protein [Gossypium raimondii]
MIRLRSLLLACWLSSKMKRVGVFRGI